MSDDRRLAQSTAAWSGDDAAPGALAEAVTVDGRGGDARAPATIRAEARYELVGELGRGGMAVVHAALDRQLGRRVALKLVRPDRVDAAGRARLLREAQAMARLRHPNVVQVFDAGTLGAQVFVAMELVDGGSLARWLASAERDWRAIVRVFVDAGRGLAAAHAAGLVHRDFKPDNVLVEPDGTARVADFGLAVTGGDDAEARTVDGAAPLPSITHTGMLIGTPAFMAPEQLAGEPATAAADQFAFCVALYRALHGVAPFAGDTPDTLRASIEAGALTAPTAARALPAWLVAAVRRGLAAAPTARHPSMDALVAELARERGWRRWRLPVVGATAIVATGAAIAVAATRPDGASPEARCDGGATELAAVWSPARRAELATRFDAIATPLAAATRDRTLAALDTRAAAWTSMHRAACVDHARGTQSDRALDLRMRCLHQRKDELAAAAAVLARTDAATVGNAVDVAVRLAPIADCGDLALLESELPPPPTLDARAAADALRARLAAVDALDHAGRSEEALAAVAPVVADARTLDDPATLITALTLEGRIRLVRNDWTAAIAPLREARERALAVGATRAAVEAGARALFVEAVSAARPVPELLAEASLLEPLSRTLRDRFARPLLLNNLGVVRLSAGDRDAARRAFLDARDARGAGPPADLELLAIDRNLALAIDDRRERDTILRQAWEQARDVLGPEHLTVITAHATYAHMAASFEDAHAATRQIALDLSRLHPGAVELQTHVLAFALLLEQESKNEPGARATLIAMASLPSTDDSAPWREFALLSVSDDEPSFISQRIERLSTGDANAAAWWQRQTAASIMEAGAYALASTAPRDAERLADRAVGVFSTIDVDDRDLELGLRRARARITQGALLRQRGQLSAAHVIEAPALEFYRALGSRAHAARITQLSVP